MSELLPGERIGLSLTGLKPGDPVVWTRCPKGGWGYYEHIPARVVRVGKVRVTIEVGLHVGGFKRISVNPVSLSLAAPPPAKEETPGACTCGAPKSGKWQHMPYCSAGRIGGTT